MLERQALPVDLRGTMKSRTLTSTQNSLSVRGQISFTVYGETFEENDDLFSSCVQPLTRTQIRARVSARVPPYESGEENSGKVCTDWIAWNVIARMDGLANDHRIDAVSRREKASSSIFAATRSRKFAGNTWRPGKLDFNFYQARERQLAET